MSQSSSMAKSSGIIKQQGPSGLQLHTHLPTYLPTYLRTYLFFGLKFFQGHGPTYIQMPGLTPWKKTMGSNFSPPPPVVAAAVQED